MTSRVYDNSKYKEKEKGAPAGGGGDSIGTNTFGIGGIFPAEQPNADHVNDHPKPKERLLILNRYNHISMHKI